MLDPSNQDGPTGHDDDPMTLHDGPINLHNETMNVFVWLARVLGAFWRAQPRITAMVICAPVLARFTGLAAFLIPLKVLLLAGSEGVPRYFKFFMNSEDKLFWMVALSIAAALLYLVTLFLRSLSDRLSEAGSLEVMKEANKLALFGQQTLIGRRHFKEVTALCANLVFVTIALVAIAIINPLLFLFLAALFAIQYGFTAFTLERQQQVPSKLDIQIREHSQDYLQHLHTIDFWLAFAVILTPFVIGAGGNVLLAILSLILARLVLGSLKTAIGSVLRLVNQKHLIDALTFSSHQWRRADSPSRRSLHTLFERKAHVARLEAALAGDFETPRPVAIRWRDSFISGVSTFVLTFRAGSKRRYYQEQVFSPYHSHLLKNEEILFNHIDRELLNAPVIRQHFAHGQFQCRLCDYGSGAPASPAVWSARLPELLEQVWSVEPPDELVRIYSTSHVLCHDRLTPEITRKLELAVDSEKQAATLHSFDLALPTIRDVLSTMPLYVFNRDMMRINTAARKDGRVSIMMWGRWSLQPVGAYLPRSLGKAELSAILARVCQRRPKFSETLSYEHVQLAAACRQLELSVADSNYEGALHILSAIVRNPILTSDGTSEAATIRMASDQDVRVTP